MKERHLPGAGSSRREYRHRRCRRLAIVTPSKRRGRSPEKRRVPSPVRPSTLQSFSANLSVSLNWFSYDLNLSFQFNSALISGRLLDSVNQLKHIGRGRAAVVYDEITVHFRDARFSDRRIL